MSPSTTSEAWPLSASSWPSQSVTSLVAGKSPEPSDADEPVALVDALEHEFGSRPLSKGTSGTRMRSRVEAPARPAPAAGPAPPPRPACGVAAGRQRSDDDPRRRAPGRGDEGEQGQALGAGAAGRLRAPRGSARSWAVFSGAFWASAMACTVDWYWCSRRGTFRRRRPPAGRAGPCSVSASFCNAVDLGRAGVLLVLEPWAMVALATALATFTRLVGVGVRRRHRDGAVGQDRSTSRRARACPAAIVPGAAAAPLVRTASLPTSRS